MTASSTRGGALRGAPDLRLDGRRYSKASAKRRCQQILRSVPIGGRVRDRDYLFLEQLLHRHPDATVKTGVGVAYFEVEATPDGHNRRFAVVRIDGTRVVFSFHRALDAPSRLHDARNAMRRAIHPDMASFRDRAFGDRETIRCPIHSIEITREQAHVDHRHPHTFVVLADEWAETAGGYDAVVIGRDPGPWGGQRMLNTEQIGSWRAFHNQRARLRVVSRAANTGALRQLERRTP